MSNAIRDRFFAKVRKTETCWLWTGSIIPDGYGQFRVAGRKIRGHRWAYEDALGPIPPGLELDHVRTRGCTNRHCVNPAHLEAVTHAENVRRGDTGLARGAQQRSKRHCPQGHPYSGANLYVRPNGVRDCRECRLAAGRRYVRRTRRKGLST